ncbi:MAG: MerR family transcriptional regulator [Bdellovibrio sp.]
MNPLELSLDDKHAPEIRKNQSGLDEGEVSLAPSVSGAWSLPAVLCDDELLQEIQQIPDKMGFKIGDVADFLGVKQYVLRYWETEFEILRPKKASNNQRYYTKRDVENAFLVRKLLYRDRFSIEGARSALKNLKAQVKKEKDWNQLEKKVLSLTEDLLMLRDEIRRFRRQLLEESV